MRRWRKATWALVIWTGLMALWAVAGVSAVGDNCAGRTGSALEACQAGTAIGGGIGLTLIAMVWFIGFIVLALIWLMSRPQRRLCPACGAQVRSGVTVCPSCSYDFAGAARAGSTGP